MFNTFKNPELNKKNFDAIMEKWIDDGRKFGVLKGPVLQGDSGELTSKAIHRHLDKANW